MNIHKRAGKLFASISREDWVKLGEVTEFWKKFLEDKKSEEGKEDEKKPAKKPKEKEASTNITVNASTGKMQLSYQQWKAIGDSVGWTKEAQNSNLAKMTPEQAAVNEQFSTPPAKFTPKPERHDPKFKPKFKNSDPQEFEALKSHFGKPSTSNRPV